MHYTKASHGIEAYLEATDLSYCTEARYEVEEGIMDVEETDDGLRTGTMEFVFRQTRVYMATVDSNARPLF